MESLRKHLNQLLKEAIELDNNLLNRLPKSILQEAIQGKLVSQIASEGTAHELLEQIKIEKQKLVKEGKLKKSVLNDSVIFKGDDNKYYDNNFLFNFTMFHVKCKLRSSRIAQKCKNYHRIILAVSLLLFENKREEKSGKFTRLCIFAGFASLASLSVRPTEM